MLKKTYLKRFLGRNRRFLGGLGGELELSLSRIRVVVKRMVCGMVKCGDGDKMQVFNLPQHGPIMGLEGFLVQF